jgi:hypothetical protein
MAAEERRREQARIRDERVRRLQQEQEAGDEQQA